MRFEEVENASWAKMERDQGSEKEPCYVTNRRILPKPWLMPADRLVG